MLEVGHLSYAPAGKPVLSDVSFDAAPGEIVAVIGPNGAGKTTLLNILATLLVPDAGKIELEGVSPLAQPLRYRRRIGYLAERCPLYGRMTVGAYLTFRLHLKGERNLRIRRRVSDILAQCGLAEVRARRVSELSCGYRKRVGLADALLSHPALLLLDDPVAGLDLPNRRRIAAALTNASSRGIVIVTGHEIAELADWCSRLLVIRRGRLVATYRTAEYTRSDLLARVERDMSAPEGEDAAEALLATAARRATPKPRKDSAK